MADRRRRGVTRGIMGPEPGWQRLRSYGDPIYITGSAGTIFSSCNKIYDPLQNCAASKSWWKMYPGTFISKDGLMAAPTSNNKIKTSDPLFWLTLLTSNTLQWTGWAGAVPGGCVEKLRTEGWDHRSTEVETLRVGGLGQTVHMCGVVI